MGHWGVRSYENDDASDALDAAFERVHGGVYDELTDDRSPLSFDEVQTRLANTATLTAAVEALGDVLGTAPDAWDEVGRLAFAGIVVRHAEADVAVPDDLRQRAIDWLEHEDIDWQEATLRKLRRNQEIALLRRVATNP